MVRTGISLCALVLALSVAGCGPGPRPALPPPRAASYEAYDGQGRQQHFSLRVGDGLSVAVSDRGLRACVGAGAGCLISAVTGGALTPRQPLHAMKEICNDAKPPECVYGEAVFHAGAIGAAQVRIAGGRCQATEPCWDGKRLLLTVNVEVRAAPPHYGSVS